jgi:hypothetical protein
MERIFHSYELWEDYKNLMYSDRDLLGKDKLVIKSINLLSDVNEFYKVMLLVIDNWKYSCENNLTNNNKNRKAWLGAAACSFNHKCPEYLTRVAWSLLDKKVQDKANNIAQKIIEQYEAKNRKIHQELGTTMLF